MAVIAVIGWKFNKDELIDFFNCETIFDFIEVIDDINENYCFLSVDEDYTNVVFGPYYRVCDNWSLHSIDLESIYEWYKYTKHEVILHSKDYIPSNLNTYGQEPNLYFISDGE